MATKIITCALGDITESNAEAIVNAANNHLWMGSGVAGAIKRKGGTEIELEALAKGPIDVGQAVATGAGALPQKYVIHAAAMGQDLRTNSTKVRLATSNALLRCEELGLRSIAFPALGTGVGGFPPRDAARIMVAEARDFLAKSKYLLQVDFILFDTDTFEAYRRELGGESLEI